MSRKNSIESHPDRAKIIKMIAERVPYREISGKYGMSMSAISRWVLEQGVTAVAKQFEKRQETAADIILEELHQDRKVVNMARQALLEYHIVDGKLNVSPHPEEIMVQVEELRDVDQKVVRTTHPLDYLLGLIENYTHYATVVSTRITFADRLSLLLQAVNSSLKQVNVLLKGQAQAMQQPDITRHPEYQALEAALLEVLRNYPEALEAVKRVFVDRTDI